MRLPRLRFTMRRMMAAVAIAGLLMGACVLVGRSREFQEKAEEHARSAELNLSTIRWHEELVAQYDEEAERDRHRPEPPSKRRLTKSDQMARPGEQVRQANANAKFYRKDAEARRLRMKQHEALAIKYLHAARYPWLSVAPDPK